MARGRFLKEEYAKLGKYESVRAWEDEIGGKSESTIQNARYSLYRYTLWSQKNPDELLSLRESDLEKTRAKERFRAEDELRSFARKTKGGHTMASYLKSFYKANHYPLEIKLQKPPPARESEKIPTNEELLLLATIARQPLRSIIFFQIESGARIGSLLQLTYVDIKEDYEADRVPCKITFPRKITKGKIPYVGFVGRDSINSLREFLKTRELGGETILDNTVLFVSKTGHPLSKTTTIGQVQLYAYKAGINPSIKGLKSFHPHMLRKRAQTILESRNIPLNWVDYLLGHIPRGASASAYSRPQDGQLRDAYGQAMAGLSVRPKDTVDKKQLLREMTMEFVQQQARTMGLDPMEIKIQKQRELGREVDDDEAIKLIQEATFGRLRVGPRTEEKGGEHIVIQESELVSHLDEGWQIVREMNHGGKFLVRKT